MAIVEPISAPKTNDPKELRKWYQAVALRLSYQTYAGDPTSNVLPRWIGDRCHDTANDEWYISYGTTNTDWEQITNV